MIFFDLVFRVSGHVVVVRILNKIVKLFQSGAKLTVPNAMGLLLN
jgi:hypothetical protein